MPISDKNALRKHYKEIRKNLNFFERKVSDIKIFEKIIELEAYKNANDVLVYISSEIEVDTFANICYSLNAGKRVLAPKCVPNSNDMNFYEIKSFDDLVQGAFGIYEPNDSCSRIMDFSKACCIVPALSYDRSGYRLGFGKGFYDKFLCKFSGEKIGICYDCCLSDRLPIDEFDISVDWLITEKSTIQIN